MATTGENYGRSTNKLYLEEAVIDDMVVYGADRNGRLGTEGQYLLLPIEQGEVSLDKLSIDAHKYKNANFVLRGHFSSVCDPVSVTFSGLFENQCYMVMIR